MDKKIILLFISAVLLPVTIHAETYWGGELPNIQNTQLKAGVTYSEEGVYTYVYTIISGSSNTGQIRSLDIDIKQTPGTAALSTEGIVNGPHYLQNTSSQISANPATPKMIPVGLWSPPSWISGLNVLGDAAWGGSLLQPGQTVNNFKIKPKLIPPSAGDIDKNAAVISPGEYQATEDKVAFSGKTIGPSAPPLEFKPADFLDYIVSLKNDSYGLGWITPGKDRDRDKKENGEKGILNSLDKKLSMARQRLVKGQTEEAIENLKAFMYELTALYKEDKDDRDDRNNSKDEFGERDHDHQEFITTEAYTLLKYNTRYLIEQLRLQKKEHREKKS
jgi:hypothetical protein